MKKFRMEGLMFFLMAAALCTPFIWMHRLYGPAASFGVAAIFLLIIIWVRTRGGKSSS